MLRTHTCGQLTINNLGETISLAGWVQKSRDLGGTTFIDIRDRYGLTQLVLNEDTEATLRENAAPIQRAETPQAELHRLLGKTHRLEIGDHPTLGFFKAWAK